MINGTENYTTVMLRNIPIKFTQSDMLSIIDKRHAVNYDFFYMPMDLKTHCNRGFAYLNFSHPFHLLDFYLEFQSLRWSECFSNCNSNKVCMLHYANVQSQQANIDSLKNKKIMQSTEISIKPILRQTIKPSAQALAKIKSYYEQKLIKEPKFAEQILSLSSGEPRIEMQAAASEPQMKKPGYNNRNSGFLNSQAAPFPSGKSELNTSGPAYSYPQSQASNAAFNSFI